MPKREYVHLSLSERDLITTMLVEEKSLGEIAKALGRSKSTVSRELKRNATPAYRLYMSHRAHGRAEERKKQAIRIRGSRTSASKLMCAPCSKMAGCRN